MSSILRLGAVLLGAISLVTAAPVEVEKRGMLYTIRLLFQFFAKFNTAVASNVLDQLQFFSQYSAAAYCLVNNDSPGTKITCPQGNCARVEAADTKTLIEFQK